MTAFRLHLHGINLEKRTKVLALSLNDPNWDMIYDISGGLIRGTSVFSPERTLDSFLQFGIDSSLIEID
jgi:hypothetical protein